MTDEEFAQALADDNYTPPEETTVETPVVETASVPESPEIVDAMDAAAAAVEVAGFQAGNWTTLDYAARQQFAFDEISAIRNPGVTDERITRYIAQDKKTQAFINNGQLIKNADVHVRIPGGGLSEKYIQAVLSEVEQLNLTNPRPNMVISVATAARNTYGSAVLGDAHINLAKSATVMKAFVIGSPEAGTYKMPSLATVSQLRYTLAHEWGHAIDVARSEGAADREALVKRLYAENPGFLSSYGKTKTTEAFAELFAEFYLTNGQTDNKLVQAFAKEFGWKV
jgi:hypothetical protein